MKKRSLVMNNCTQMQLCLCARTPRHGGDESEASLLSVRRGRASDLHVVLPGEIRNENLRNLTHNVPSSTEQQERTWLCRKCVMRLSIARSVRRLMTSLFMLSDVMWGSSASESGMTSSLTFCHRSTVPKSMNSLLASGQLGTRFSSLSAPLSGFVASFWRSFL